MNCRNCGKEIEQKWHVCPYCGFDIISYISPNPEVMEEYRVVKTSVIRWMGVHGLMCLALRHPALPEQVRKEALVFVKKLGKLLVEWGALSEDQLDYAEKTEVAEGSSDFM